MADILKMLSQAQGPQEEALAQEIIRSLMGGGGSQPQGDPVNRIQSVEQAQVALGPAAAKKNTTINAPRNAYDQAGAEANAMLGGLSRLGSVEDIRAMLGGAATPAPAGPDQSPAETSRLGRMEQALMNAVSAQQDTRLATVLDAQQVSLGQPAAESEPEAKGPVSTDGTVEWVNESGIAKVKQANGSYLFTNVQDSTGAYTSAYMPEKKKDFNQMGQPVAGKIKDQLSQIRSSTSSEVAEVLAGQLNSSIAQEYVRMENDAYDMAAGELGIAKVQKALMAQQTLDSSARVYDPAMGESAETTRLRQQLSSMEAQAKQRAQDWLSRNVSYNQLKVVENEAKAAVTLAVTKAAAQEDRVALKEQDAERKREIKKEEARMAVTSLPPAQRMLAVRLNADLRGENKEEAMVKYLNSQSKDKQFQEIWATDPTEYPALAFKGNKLAQQLVIEDEAAALGMDPSQVEEEFKAYGSMVPSDKDVRAWAERTIGADNPEEKKRAVNEFIAQYNTSKMGTTSAAIKQRKDIEAQLKVARLRLAREQRMVSQVTSWAQPGSELFEAAKKASEITGKSDLRSTLAQLTMNKPLEQQIALMRDVRESMVQSAAKYDRSVYGGLDSGKLINEFNQSALDLGQLADMYRRQIGNQPLFGPIAQTAYDAIAGNMYDTVLK